MRFQTIDKYEEEGIHDEEEFDLSPYNELDIYIRGGWKNLLFCFVLYSTEDSELVEELYNELMTISDFIEQQNELVSIYSLDEHVFALIDLGHTTGIAIARKDRDFFENYIL